MGDIQIRIENVSAVIAALEGIKKKLDPATRKATQQSGDELRRAARSNFVGWHAPGIHHVGGDQPNRVSGDLQQSIIALTPVSPMGPAKYQTRIGPTAIYSRVIELGAHITPKEAKMLSWFDAEMGVRRYEKGVTIPPRPFFTPAALSLAPKMRAIFVTAWKDAIDG